MTITVPQPSMIIQKTCYVIMPFSTTKSHNADEWDRFYEKLFKPSLQNLGYTCNRSKASVGAIMNGILTSIHSSEVILADLTDAKPNVFYELGIAHSITNRVIMVTQDLGSVSSDLKAYGVIEYKTEPGEGYMTFASNIATALGRFTVPKPPASNPVAEFIGTNMRTLELILEQPTALLQCAKCHRVYQVPVGGMGHGHPGVNCGHWEPSIFKGLATGFATLQLAGFYV